MTGEYNLNRFLDAQETTYEIALAEIRSGRKRSHWMWFIFPQVSGLGFSETSRYYGINDMGEAATFLAHPVLGSRLIRTAQELLKLDTNNANSIFGSPDDLKLKSSMTLFAALPGADPVFENVLDKFFGGVKDAKTLHLLNKEA